ncbi:uncharacterized protein DUF4292 [Neolewinella xylanilytica]|uniref:Uncharacterized protein DUF4292 n=1 Tax=Neolewinella xylanilytica TaxID=1514080 RepID=A0A2S6I9H2_9BACT|nr:DUF4292 domain-containing protein [Neolewinella xylanilytica]PPK88141.1 uncharacterized protein DUF4292 [Neolewinella xylanilytica]
MRLFFLALSALLLFANCNRKVAGPTDDGIALPAGKLRLNQVLRGIEANRTSAEWMDAKARVDVETDDLSIGGTAYLRLHRDEAIWMSVKKFGIEGARALIRPDSFFLYNRLESEYTAEPLSYLEAKYKIPARFDLLQEIFFGNAVFLTDNLEVSRDGQDIRLTGSSREFAADYRYDPVTYQLGSMELQELGQQRMLSVVNGDYAAVDGLSASFPRTRRIAVDGGSEGTARLDFEFTDLSFSGPLEMPFIFR